MKHTNVLKSNTGASYTNHTCEREEELHMIGSTLIGWPCKGCELVCAFTYMYVHVGPNPRLDEA